MCHFLLLTPATPFPVTEFLKNPVKEFLKNPVKEFLKKHETEFFSVVDARLSLRKLKRLQVITQDIMALINAATNDEDAQEILYEHLTDHADVDSLLKYCEVIIAAEGYPRMRSLGMKMKEDLQCMQGGWLCVYTYVRACVPVCMRACVHISTGDSWLEQIPYTRQSEPVRLVGLGPYHFLSSLLE